MKHDEDYFDFHLLICTNTRENGEDCGSKGAAKLVEELKPWAKEWSKAESVRLGRPFKARVNKSGCLGRCSEGIACVAYPKGEWLTQVQAEEIEEIQGWIQKSSS